MPQSNENQRIGEKAVQKLISILPLKKGLEIRFDELSKNDFGIDARIQIFKDNYHTGQIYFVQIKGTNTKLEKDSNDKLKFYLDDSDSKEFLKNTSVVAALVLVDLSSENNEKIYFYCL